MSDPSICRRAPSTPLRAPRWTPVALALVVAACGGSTEWGESRIDLADLVLHQRDNVTTQLLWPARGIGTERLKRGWAPPADGEHLEIAGRWADAHLFSVDAAGTRLEIDAELDDAVTAPDPTLRVRMNGADLVQLALEHGRRSYTVEVPADAVRRGRNTLELQLRPLGLRAREGLPSGLRLHRLTSHPGGSRALWAERPDKIRVASRADGRAIELPAPAFLDVVAEIAAPARLEARVLPRFPSDRGTRDVELYVELLDASGETHTLHRKALRRGHRLALDLAAWRDQLVRIRLGVAGMGNAVVELTGAALSGHANLLSGAQALGPGAPAPPPLGRPDVVFILVDAARADAFGVYGGPHPTPEVDALAAAGTRFARALSAAPWTGQSVPSVFTGLYPDSIGIEHWGSRLPAAPATLAERFAALDYRTVLWSQHPFYSQRADLKRGFSEYYSTPDHDREMVPTPELLSGDGDRPLFAFLHLLPPHTPYAPPPPHFGELTGWYEGDTPVDAAFLNRFPGRQSPDSLSAADLRYIRDRYQENTLFADALIGRIREALEAADRFDDALVVILADHGEAFLEHDRFMHGQKVYGELLHVPLVIKWPVATTGFRPVIDDTVTLVDLAPTVLDALGLPADPTLQGESLLPRVFQGAAGDRPIYATTRTTTDPVRVARFRATLEVGGWKLVWDGDTLASELYRLAEDPAEARDVAAEFPMEALLLEQMLLMRRALHRQVLEGFGGESRSEALDPETEARLRALGYL